MTSPSLPPPAAGTPRRVDRIELLLRIAAVIRPWTCAGIRWVRHPSYAGMLLIFGAIGLSQRNCVSLAIVLVFPTAALLYRIHVEEMALTEAFGEDYVEYTKATRRPVPGIY